MINKIASQKQKIARARNWNKGMLLGIKSNLINMENNQSLNIGLTKNEKETIKRIKNNLISLLSQWKKSIT